MTDPFLRLRWTLGQVLILSSACALVLGTAARTQAVEDKMPWVTDHSYAFQLAASRNQLVLLHFTSDHCPPCRRLEQCVFTQANFAHAIGNEFVPVKVNVAHYPDLARRYSVESWPTDILVTPDGREVHRMISPQDPGEYLQTLRQVAWHHHTQADGQSLAGYQPMQHARRSNDVYSTTGPVASGAPVQTTVQTTATARTSQFRPSDAVPVGYNSVEIQNPFVGSPPTDRTATADRSERSDRSDQMDRSDPTDQPDRTDQISSSVAPSSSTVVPVSSGTTPYVTPSIPSPMIAPQPPAVPSSSPVAPETLGIDGYCPIAVLEKDQWIPGDRRYGARHRGMLYLFQDAVSQQRFLSDPDRYSPALAGYDPVAFADRGQYVPGMRAHGVRYNDRMYLFENETNLVRFSQYPDHYAGVVQRAMGSR